MEVTATDAKNRFGYYLAQAKIEPVKVLKNDRVEAVMISAARFAELEALEHKRNLAARKKDFNVNYKEWIAAQNEHFEKHGLWSDGLRVW